MGQLIAADGTSFSGVSASLRSVCKSHLPSLDYNPRLGMRGYEPPSALTIGYNV